MVFINFKILFLMLIVFVSYSNCIPIVIKSAVNKNIGEDSNQNHFDVVGRKGIANYEGEAGFNNENQGKSVTANDAGRYGEQSGVNKGHLDQSNFNKNNFQERDGGHVENVAKQGASKKGHHKSGFHNSYYKDETGSNSSFYDDGEDHKEEFIQRNNKGAYGDASQLQHNGGNRDNAQHWQEQAKRGQYDNSGQYQKADTNRRDYDRQNYFNNREDIARRGLANNYDSGRRYLEEEYVNRPPVYPVPYYEEPYRSPHTSRHITIYEDPRYVDSYRDRPNIELDVRRRPYDNRYHEDRRIHDDYYY